jgi:hypothetical protein
LADDLATDLVAFAAGLAFEDLAFEDLAFEDLVFADFLARTAPAFLEAALVFDLVFDLVLAFALDFDAARAMQHSLASAERGVTVPTRRTSGGEAQPLAATRAPRIAKERPNGEWID